MFQVFFVTKEDSVPYQRPPLSKEMWLNPDPPDPKVLTYIQDDKRKTLSISIFYLPMIIIVTISCRCLEPEFNYAVLLWIRATK